MTRKLNKQLTVYLSKSLLIPESRLELVRNVLTGLGFNVTEYHPVIQYHENIVRNADFVIFVTCDTPYITRTTNPLMFDAYVGKGQYSEAEICRKLNKPAFLLHALKSGDLLISKLVGDDYTKAQTHFIYDSNDWKRRYGIIKSYVIGMSVVPLFPMLEGLFGLYDLAEYPLTPDQCYQINNRLLLLLK